MGKWLQTNGEAIYGTGPNPFPATPTASAPGGRAGNPPVVWDWRATSKLNKDGTGKIYLHIFKWPADGNFAVPGNSTVRKAYLLSDPAHHELNIIDIADGGLVTSLLQLPKTAPDPIASVVVLEVGK